MHQGSWKLHEGFRIPESEILNGTGEVTRFTRLISDRNDILSGSTEQQTATTAARAAEYQIQSLSAINGRFKLRRYNVGE